MTVGDLASLARDAQSGDPVAREKLLVELYRDVRKHISLMIGSGAIADDAVQNTMLAIYRGLPGFRGDAASPRTWALKIATRVAYRLRRKEERYQLVEDGTLELEGFDLTPAAAAELVMLRRALASLTPKKRDAFVLMEIFEMSAEEAGKVLGTFANTAASRCRHARAELQARFKKNDEFAQIVATEDKGAMDS